MPSRGRGRIAFAAARVRHPERERGRFSTASVTQCRALRLPPPPASTNHHLLAASPPTAQCPQLLRLNPWNYMPHDTTFDDALASSFVGKYILIGITYLDSRGTVLRQQQLHGIIRSASRSGVVVELKGSHEGETWTMPPDLRGIRTAKPGRYRLRDSNETVVDPELMVTWTRTAPPTAH